MSLLKFILCSLIILPAMVHADNSSDIASCASIDNNAKRLECYDKLSKRIGVDKPTIKASRGKKKWKIREETSRIDDSTNVYLYVDSEDIVRYKRETTLPRLYVRCKEGDITVYIVWNLYLGIDYIDVLTRFDKEEALTYEWNISTDYKAVFVKGNGIYFINQMIKHDKMLVQLTPYGASPVMTTFDISGLTETLPPLRKACKWE